MYEWMNEWTNQSIISLKIICPTDEEFVNITITVCNILKALVYLILLLLIGQLAGVHSYWIFIISKILAHKIIQTLK